jgi:uncharacterized protein DUF3825
MAEPEEWQYHQTPPTEHQNPILYNYLRYTSRVAEEGKISVSDDGQFIRDGPLLR